MGKASRLFPQSQNSINLQKRMLVRAMPGWKKLHLKSKRNLINAIHANADKLPRNQKSGAITYKNEQLVIELTPAKEKLRVRAADQPKAPEDSENEE